MKGSDLVRILVDTEDQLEGWQHIGDISVDTGRIIIADPCYFDGCDLTPSELTEPLIQVDILDLCIAHGVDFDTIRQNPKELERIASLRRRFGEGRFPGGLASFVATKTGFGDGRYPAFAKVENDRVVGVWIDFECGKHVPEEEE